MLDRIGLSTGVAGHKSKRSIIMSKFESLYRSVDRLSAAVNRAEAYLMKHPAGDVIYWLPEEISEDYFGEIDKELFLTSDDEEKPWLFLENNARLGLGMDRTRLALWSYWENSEDTGGTTLLVNSRLLDLCIEARVLYSSFIPALIRLADEMVDAEEIKVHEIILAIDAALPQGEAVM
jgi:hypothetical protein